MNIHVECAAATAAATPWPITYAPLLSAIAVGIIGLVTVTIAYRQWRTAHSKFRLDLFNERKAVYRACRELLGHITRTGTASNDQLVTFNDAVRDADFLFDDKIAKYVENLRRLGIELNFNPVGPADPAFTQSVVQWRVAAMTWVGKQYEAAKSLFAPYLRIDESLATIIVQSVLRLFGWPKVPALPQFPTYP